MQFVMKKDKFPERLDRKVIYKSKWVNLYRDKVRFPDGRLIPEHHLVDIENPGVAVVVANDKDEILLVQAYRYTTNSIEWETPGGGFKKGTSVTEAAKREVLEETGYKTKNHKKVKKFNPQNGISNHEGYVVFCNAGEKVSDYDEGEIKGFKWFKKKEVEKMIKENVINCGYTFIALLLYLKDY